VPSQKRDKQWVSSRAKAAAMEAARRRKSRKRLGAALGLGVLVIAIVGAAAFAGGGSKTTTTTTVNPAASLVSSTTAPPSAAGKPCVALADPLPAGAPAVPVKVGPPPAALVSEDLKVGDGAEIVAGGKATFNYIGVSCSTGKIFDSSYSRGQPFPADLSPTAAQGVIKGWQQGIPGMKVGGQRLLGLPPALAYGNNSPSPDIAAGETLWFVVELVSVP
jgi:peptidylprolyl isomerase